MRALLTFILVLLLVWRLDAATVSAPTIVEISPSTPPTAALSLTNIFKNLSNNMVLRLLPGTHTVQVFPGADHNGLDAHLKLFKLTNVVVEGLGPQSVIFHAQTGNVFSVASCENITFRNFAVTGVKPTGTNIPVLDTLFCTFNMQTNQHWVFDNLTIKNQYDHVIAGVVPRSEHYGVVKNCWFENCGNTNMWPIDSSYPFGDGVVVHAIGSYMQVLNNVFTNCGLCFEIEGDAPAGGVRNVLFEGNTLVAGTEDYVMNYDTGDGENGFYSDFTLRNNTFRFLPGHGVEGNQRAIVFVQIDRVNVVENFIENADVGIFWNSSQPTIGARILDNTLKDIRLHGIQTSGSDGFTEFIISRNYFTNVGGEGILLATATKSRISENIFDNVADGVNGAGCIRLSGSDSNTVTGNIVARFGASAFSPIYIEASADRNHIYDNDIWHWGTGIPYTDLGVENRIQNNWFGTNFFPRMMVTDSLGITNCTAALTIGAPQTLLLRLTVSASAAITLNGTTAIADGYYHGQRLEITMIDAGAGSVTINDAANTNLGANRVLSNQDTLVLVYDATASLWVELAFANN